MNETPMLFPLEPHIFWERMKALIEEIINEKLKQPAVKQEDLILKKTLLKLNEVCEIFRISKPTVYEWVR